jgi:hypothetical protein
MTYSRKSKPSQNRTEQKSIYIPEIHYSTSRNCHSMYIIQYKHVEQALYSCLEPSYKEVILCKPKISLGMSKLNNMQTIFFLTFPILLCLYNTIPVFSVNQNILLLILLLYSYMFQLMSGHQQANKYKKYKIKVSR